jgi:hypothetical protein
VPRSGHPDPLRGGLIVEAVLAGWQHRCGQTASLARARERLRAIESERSPRSTGAPLPASRCPRSGTATALADAAAGRDCPACGAPLVVEGHGVPPREPELELRGGAWSLARRRA